MVEDAQKGVQITLEGGWLGKTIAALVAALVIALCTTVVQIQMTRFTVEDGAKLERMIEHNRASMNALEGQQRVNTQRLLSLEKSVDEVKNDTEWIRRRMEGGAAR